METKAKALGLPENIILGSGSPRRKELLLGIGAEFVVRKPDIEETWPDELAADKVAEYLAREKAKALSEKYSDLIITADTVVIFAGKILGKPENADEAVKMITTLSGKFHDVITGVCLSEKNKILSFSDRTRVQFKDLSPSEIDYYIEQYEPFDKAGAYGIQEWIGMIGILHMEGSYFNVMGLPVHRVYDELIKWNQVSP